MQKQIDAALDGIRGIDDRDSWRDLKGKLHSVLGDADWQALGEQLRYTDYDAYKTLVRLLAKMADKAVR
jgi:hypothetical protein